MMSTVGQLAERCCFLCLKRIIIAPLEILSVAYNVATKIEQPIPLTKLSIKTF